MDKIYFNVNGEHYSLLGSEVSPQTTLNEYLRSYLQLHGTKAMCHEGGCGACVVSVSRTHPATKVKEEFAVNSCLVHILSCHEWSIKTVEGVGGRGIGYHPIQQRLADFGGTQCGYCTPGWVMAMYSLQKAPKSLTMAEIEKSFGGNMCRCTGYRPILDAFKTFASDADPNLIDKLQDLEDLDQMKCLKRKVSETEKEDGDWCIIDKDSCSLLSLPMGEDKSRWYKAYSLEDVFEILAKEGTSSYRLIAGNTGKGVYPISIESRVLIDISSISSLKDTSKNMNLNIGAGVSLTELIDLFKKWSESNLEFKYMSALSDHVKLIANEPVRNIGTLGGNLALKNAHPEFPSDIFVILSTVGATVTVVNHSLENKDLKMDEFLVEDLKNQMILNVKLPPMASDCVIRTYKVMPRAQNTHAVMNAGFLFKLDSENKILSSTIVFGAVSASFIRSKNTENILKGEHLFSNETLSKALKSLNEELKTVAEPPDMSPVTRKRVALGLFYKAVLSIALPSSRFTTGGMRLPRGVSSGQQHKVTDKTVWPLSQPVKKLEALAQCAGEVRYVCEMTSHPRDVHAAFVLAPKANAEVLGFDDKEAKKIPGFIAFYSAKDIPGKNCFTPADVPWQQSEEEIFCSKRTLYTGQPVGIVAAITRNAALMAAKLVKVKLGPSVRPVLSVKEALVAADKERRVREDATIDPTDKGTDTVHVIKGKYQVPSQYHYTMETQSCYASRDSTGRLKLRPSSQWLDLVHVAVAGALGIKENEIELETPRLGGGYGGKASRSGLVACACALVAYKLNRNATLTLPMTDNMEAIGKRQECDFEYELGVDQQGLIQYLDLTYYSDCGSGFNDSACAGVASCVTGLYSPERWKLRGSSVLTDKPANTWCRAPSTTEGTAILEHIMERIAHTTNQDPIDIRIKHIAPPHTALIQLINTLKTDSKFEDRKNEIEKFNSENAWKKRALKMSVMSYPIDYYGNFPVTVSVYHGDGSVMAAHGGIEMGQGINTKVAQVIAYKLGLTLDQVTIKSTDTFTSPNSMASNGSITSECVANAALKACDILLERIHTDGKKEGLTWKQKVKNAYDEGINLQATSMTSQADALQGYSVYGACVLEVELDVLTGEFNIRRADILEDTGRSMSPDIDVGQIEGAFIMGLGLWSSERLVYATNGRLLTSRTWNYTPPGALDIPEDMRIQFVGREGDKIGVLRSKATGEPAMVLAVVLSHALRECVVEARKEFGRQDIEWIYLDAPCNIENILEAISPDIAYYKLQ